MGKEKVSVIVPVYNREKTIEGCINSILSNDYSNLEIIIIDDGSTDNSVQICDNFQINNINILTFHQRNQGVSAARNQGLKLSTGKWVCFVDSDDMVSSSYVSDMVKDIVDSDMVFSANGIKIDGYQSLRGKDAIEYIISRNLFQGGVYEKLYKMSIIKENSISFKEGLQIGEDTLFLLKYLFYSDRIVFDQNLANYTIGRCDTSLVLANYDINIETTLFTSVKFELIKLLSKFYTKESALSIAWNKRLKYYLERCIYSAIRNKENGALEVLCNLLPEDDWQEFGKYYKPKSIVDTISSFFIKHRLFFMYELLERTIQFKRTRSFTINMKF